MNKSMKSAICTVLLLLFSVMSFPAAVFADEAMPAPLNRDKMRATQISSTHVGKRLRSFADTLKYYINQIYLCTLLSNSHTKV